MLGNGNSGNFWILADRVYMAFPGYNPGGSTKSTFPTVTAVNLASGQPVDCQQYNQFPDRLQGPPTNPPSSLNYGHVPTRIVLKNGAQFLGTGRGTGSQLTEYLEIRAGLLFCVLHGPTAGRRWEPSAARKQLRRAAEAAGVRRRFAPHQLRHAHAIELAHEGVPLVVIQRQLGYCNSGVTSRNRQRRDHPDRAFPARARHLSNLRTAHSAVAANAHHGGRPWTPGGRRPSVHPRAGVVSMDA
jgi:hypothetical protein